MNFLFFILIIIFLSKQIFIRNFSGKVFNFNLSDYHLKKITISKSFIKTFSKMRFSYWIPKKFKSIFHTVRFKWFTYFMIHECLTQLQFYCYMICRVYGTWIWFSVSFNYWFYFLRFPRKFFERNLNFHARKYFVTLTKYKLWIFETEWIVFEKQFCFHVLVNKFTNR